MEDENERLFWLNSLTLVQQWYSFPRFSFSYRVNQDRDQCYPFRSELLIFEEERITENVYITLIYGINFKDISVFKNVTVYKKKSLFFGNNPILLKINIDCKIFLFLRHEFKKKLQMKLLFK